MSLHVLTLILDEARLDVPPPNGSNGSFEAENRSNGSFEAENRSNGSFEAENRSNGSFEAENKVFDVEKFSLKFKRKALYSLGITDQEMVMILTTENLLFELLGIWYIIISLRHESWYF